MQSNPNSIIKSIPFFACLSGKEFLELEQIILKKHFLKNEIILLEEDSANYIYIVYSGRVKVIQTNIDGREQILAIHTKGDFFGEMSMLDRKTSPATVIAMEDSDIGMITRDNFERYLLKNETVLKEIISMLCLRLREAWLMFKVLRFADAEHKVRAVLKFVSEQNGIKDPRGTIITLKLTHEDIAAYASVSRETVTRLIGRFLKDEEIEILDKKYILLKPAFLEKTLFV